MRSNGTLVIVLACALGGGCKRRTGFCAQDLSGTWTKAADESTSYSFDDRGDTVLLHVDRADGGSSSPPIHLQRTAAGVRGTMPASATTASGKPCQLDVDLEVTSCRPNDVVLHTEEVPAVQEDCARSTTQPDGSPLLRRSREFTVYRQTSAVEHEVHGR